MSTTWRRLREPGSGRVWVESQRKVLLAFSDPLNLFSIFCAKRTTRTYSNGAGVAKLAMAEITSGVANGGRSRGRGRGRANYRTFFVQAAARPYDVFFLFDIQNTSMVFPTVERASSAPLSF